MRPNSPNRFLKTALPAFCTLALAACSVGPDFSRPQTAGTETYSAQLLPASTSFAPILGGETQNLAQGPDIPTEWWTLFHNASLNALIFEALKTNADLDSARAALRRPA